MTENRSPYWLTTADRAALAECIAHLIDNVRILPGHRGCLDAVLTELGVAEARNQVWPGKAEIVRFAAGYSDDVLPIRMSREERAAVLTIPSLSPSVRTALTGGNEK